LAPNWLRPSGNTGAHSTTPTIAFRVQIMHIHRYRIFTTHAPSCVTILPCLTIREREERSQPITCPFRDGAILISFHLSFSLWFATSLQHSPSAHRNQPSPNLIHEILGGFHQAIFLFLPEMTSCLRLSYNKTTGGTQEMHPDRSAAKHSIVETEIK
jgi:hypothetical protein